MRGGTVCRELDFVFRVRLRAVIFVPPAVPPPRYMGVQRESTLGPQLSTPEFEFVVSVPVALVICFGMSVFSLSGWGLVPEFC